MSELPSYPLGWHVIEGWHLLDTLHRVADGEEPDLVYAELWANAERKQISHEAESSGESRDELLARIATMTPIIAALAIYGESVNLRVIVAKAKDVNAANGEFAP